MKINDRISIERRWNLMKNEMQSWVPGWRDIQRFIDPDRGFFEGTIPNYGRSTDHKTQLDNMPQRALRTLGAGMTTGMTSQDRPWMKIGLQDTDLMEFEPVKEWLEKVEMILYSIFAGSNTYSAFNSMYEELGGFGTNCALIQEDFDNVTRTRDFTIGEYFLGMNKNGEIDSFGRLYNLTVGQLVEEFGIENVTPSVKNQYERGIVDTWIKVCHLVEPNNDRIPDKSDYKNKAWRSVQWEFGSPTWEALRISGYDEFPFVATRWGVTTSSDIYGRGPGRKTLGDVKMLMMQQKDKLVALNKMIDPPIMKDGSVQGEANMLPGGVTTTSALTPNSGARPAYQINPDFNAILSCIKDTQQAIKEGFYSDLFLMLANSDSGQMTAYEVSKRYEEKLQMLGPVINRVKSEMLDKYIKRTFNIALKARIIPPPPPEVQGQPMKIQYISILAQAQKMVGTQAIEQVFSFASSQAQTFPGIVDVIDADDGITEYAEKLGVPARMIRSKEELVKVRQDKQNQQEAEQAAATVPAMVDGAKTLSDTKLGQNSALDAIVGGQGKQPIPVGANK